MYLPPIFKDVCSSAQSCPTLGIAEGLVVKNLPTNAGDERDVGLTLGQSGRSPEEEGTGSPPVFLPGKTL